SKPLLSEHFSAPKEREKEEKKQKQKQILPLSTPSAYRIERQWRRRSHSPISESITSTRL
ncbi:hypothetical protein ACLOJK_020184, partial [Asimina triloba]